MQNIIKPREMPNLSDESSMDMYGINKETLKSILIDLNGDALDVQICAMAFISDAQEIMPRNAETARQWLNVAKWLMSHVSTEIRKNAA